MIVGPGVSISSYELGSSSVAGTFAPNSTYTYFDNNLPNNRPMVFSTSNGSAISTIRGTLEATASASGAASFTRHGKTVSRIVAVRYRVVLDDRSPKTGFDLQETDRHPLALTSPSFVGKRSVTVNLAPGTGCSLPEPVQSAPSW